MNRTENVLPFVMVDSLTIRFILANVYTLGEAIQFGNKVNK